MLSMLLILVIITMIFIKVTNCVFLRIKYGTYTYWLDWLERQRKLQNTLNILRSYWIFLLNAKLFYKVFWITRYDWKTFQILINESRYCPVIKGICKPNYSHQNFELKKCGPHSWFLRKRGTPVFEFCTISKWK